MTINPLREVGLLRFKHPQKASGLVGGGTELTDLYLQVQINGDVALLKALQKGVLERKALDRGFIDAHTHGFDAVEKALAETEWDELIEASGVERKLLDQAADIGICNIMALRGDPPQGEESFQTAREMEIRQSSTLESTASMNTISTTSDSNEETAQYRAMALDEQDETENRVSTLDTAVTNSKESAPSPGRLAMSEPRLKRERVKNPKQQSSSSLVSRFVEGLEAKHKARRRDKREKKLKEKKEARLKKSS